MTQNGLQQIALFIFVLLILVKPLGWYMARVYEGQACGLNWLIKPVERFTYWVCGIDPNKEMDWKYYLAAMLLFNLAGLLAVYAIQRLQIFLPLNPQHFPNVAPDLAFNTAVSFASNTSWQAYGGETTLSYFSQMTAITVQCFLSSVTGMSLLIAFIRGLRQHQSTNLGNFWVDTVRGTYFILIPLACVIAILLASQGVIQNYKPYQTAHVLQPTKETSIQTLPMGPAASQIAIKQLGSDGGGFFNANSAHPYENPTPLSNLIELLALLLIPTAICYTYGMMVNDRPQGWAILIAMFILFLPMVYIAVTVEQQGNPILTQMGVNQTPVLNQFAGGNMEGKETRFGITNSALWAAVTTATSNGSVNSMHDSYLPLGGLVPLWLMHIGEVAFGGTGSGLYGMIMLVIIAVFVSGLMVGKMPSYLGKKIESYEMKMASLTVIIMPIIVLTFTAFAVTIHAGTDAIGNPGAHGFSEILYAFASEVNNNGSAFAGLNANTPFYNIAGGFAMLLGRYWIAIPVLAIAGSLARKKIISKSAGTLPTDTPLFVLFLVAITIILGALTFFPALSLGPIVEHIVLWKGASLN